jgi:hypothetical protein
MDQNTRTSLLQQFATLWGAVAWKSYQLQGRGVFAVQVQPQENADFTLTIEYLSRAECHHSQARHLAARYDPAVEYVLLLCNGDGNAECELVHLERTLDDVAAEVAPQAAIGR